MKSDPNPHFDGYAMDTEGNGLKSLQDIVYIKTDKYKTSEKVLPSGLIFHKPLMWQNYHHDYAVQDGIVKYAPAKIAGGGEIEIKEGDHVYTHHFLVDKDNEIEIDGELLYALRYDMVYCVVTGDKVKMLRRWNLLKPILKYEYNAEGFAMSHGVILTNPDRDDIHLKDRGIMAFPSEESIDLGIEEGAKVIFKKGADYKIIVNGELYFRIEDKYIFAIEE